MATQLKADYMLVGAGAVGMAFADTIVSETDKTLVVIDRNVAPGGHWNHAYPFVTLHQPSAFYGVASRELSTGAFDQTGYNRGLSHLATGADVNDYFDSVMRHHLLPSGQVQYFPMCDFEGGNGFVSKLSGERFEVEFDTHVDCTYLNPTLPSTHAPKFDVAEGANLIPVNDLVKVTAPPAGYVVIGAGKTGIDAILWLLANRVDPEMITWIVSRDAWLIDRENTQPDPKFFGKTLGSQANQFEAIANANSVDDMFMRLEESGVLLRIDPEVKPTMFHAATISRLELEALRRIKNVVRMGRVKRLGADEIVLDGGTLPTSPEHVHVNCSASGIPHTDTKPIFETGKITPQTVRAYQPAFSASVIAHVDNAYEDMDKKNALCGVVPIPNHATDFVPMTAANMMNQYVWSQEEALMAWLVRNRLDGFSRLIADIKPDEEEKMDIMRRVRGNLMPAVMKLQQFKAELGG